VSQEKNLTKIPVRLKKESLGLFLFFALFYIYFQAKTIYGGDSGDLVTAAWVWGIPHPPGYPLYIFLASILIHFVPLFTPAWRVGLLSSIPAALSIGLFYFLTYKISKNKTTALFSSLVLGFSYPFWLNAEVAEVFALNSLFVIILTILFLNFLEKPRIKNLIILTFFFALALTHHHTIVLLIPAFALVWYKYKNKNKLKLKPTHIVYIAVTLILGLSFYLYPLIACRKNPPVCWADPTNLANLTSLITRANYGSFKANVNIGNEPILRTYSVLAFLRMTLEDFSAIGVILIILGLLKVFKQNKQQFYLISAILATCLFFVFYASFPLANDFSIATFERFVIFPYIFFSLLTGLGLGLLSGQIRVFLKKIKLSSSGKKVLLTGFKITMFIVPFSIGILSHKKINLLKNDFTAENLIMEMVELMPQNSIFVTYSDNISFNSQYVVYVLKQRPDIKLITYNLFHAPFYKKAMRNIYPELIIPESQDRKEAFLQLVEKNSDKHNVYVSNIRFVPIKEDDNWLPKGLVWYYQKDRQNIDTLALIDQNNKVWEQTNNPFKDNPRLYQNLFLADNLRLYKEARIDYASWLYQQDELDQAQAIFITVEKIDPQNTVAKIGQGAILLKTNQCEKAKEKFEQALEIDNYNALALGYLRKTSLECFNDEEKAKFYEDRCLQLGEDQNAPLLDLEE
jgi:tetratricopeptide (TPR) repeat protein